MADASTPESLSSDDVSSIQDVISHSELRSIEYHELSARRYSAQPDAEVSDNGTLNIVVQQRSDAESFGVRLNATIVFPIGEATVSVAGEYGLLEGHEVTSRSLQLFANEVAVMTVFPYLREAVASITGRVFQQPLHLPMVKRGEIAVEVTEEA